LHYLELLSRRPQAFESARPIRQWRAGWPDSFERLLERFRDALGPSHGTKEFVGVLMLFDKHGHKEVIEAVEAAVTAGVSSREAVEHLLRRQRGAAGNDPSPMPPGTWPTLPLPDVSVYSPLGAVL
jgi:hypothetical protein